MIKSLSRERNENWSDAYVWHFSFRCCCSSSVIWFACYTKTNRNKVNSLCTLICLFCFFFGCKNRKGAILLWKLPLDGKALVLPLPASRRHQFLGDYGDDNGDDGDTKQENASSFTQLLRLTSISLLLSFCWPRVGFDVFALLSDGICSLPMMLVPGEAWMRLVHSLEPKCREALRFPYFETKFYSLSAEWQLPLAYIFVFEPVSPLAEMFIIYEWFVWLWVNFCFCCQ